MTTTPRRRLALAAPLLDLALLGAGSDDDTEATGTDQQAAPDAVSTLFDSSIAFDEKVALVEGGEAHRAHHDADVAAADSVGGIRLEPQSVTIDGDTATVDYTVFFAGTQAYDTVFDIEVTSVDGTWVVPPAAFCGFLQTARTPCAAA